MVTVEGDSIRDVQRKVFKNEHADWLAINLTHKSEPTPPNCDKPNPGVYAEDYVHGEPMFHVRFNNGKVGDPHEQFIKTLTPKELLAFLKYHIAEREKAFRRFKREQKNRRLVEAKRRVEGLASHLAGTQKTLDVAKQELHNIKKGGD